MLFAFDPWNSTRPDFRFFPFHPVSLRWQDRRSLADSGLRATSRRSGPALASISSGVGKARHLPAYQVQRALRGLCSVPHSAADHSEWRKRSRAEGCCIPERVFLRQATSLEARHMARPSDPIFLSSRQCLSVSVPLCRIRLTYRDQNGVAKIPTAPESPVSSSESRSSAKRCQS